MRKMVHACGNKMICQREEKPVSRDDLVKGFEVSKGNYVQITTEELDALEAEANRNVEIQEFVPMATVDPVYFAKTYYLGPDKAGEKPYRLLAQAMAHEKKAAIAQFVQRGQEQLVMVRAFEDDKLMLHVLYYEDEVRTFDMVPAGKGVPDRELHLASQLIRHLEGKAWQPNRYHDTYRQRVLAFIKKKGHGEKMVVPKPARTPGKVLDLMGALKASLAKQPAPAGSKRAKPRSTTSKKAVSKRRKAA
jgi:DNA end-binding protein Ku